MVGAFDDMDRVDLDVAQMLDGGAHRLGAGAERRGAVEALGAEPEAAGFGAGEREGRLDAGHAFRP